MTDELTLEEQREAELAANTAEVSRAHDLYTTGATGTDVQDDQDDRVATANATHTEVDNSDDGTTLNQTTNWQGVPVYTGGNVVKVESLETVSDEELADGVETLVQEVLVRAALDGDALFTTGPQIPPNSYDSAYLSAYVDGAWLAEASKQTGEKLF